MSAFVAGATGYTGRAVVAELRARGVDTYAHVRPDSPRLDEWRRRFGELGAHVDTTAWTAEAMAPRLAELRPSHVFALLGTTRARARRDGAGYDAVDLGLTLLLLGATPPGARFVYLSAIGADAQSANAYLAVRGKVEDRLRASGNEWVSARPSFITGDDREEPRRGERFAARALDGLLAGAAALGARAARAKWASMTGEELARGLVAAAYDPVVQGVVEAEHLRGAR